MGTNETWLLKLSRAALLLALAALIALLWSIRHSPPLGTDSLIYHLTIPAWWLQDGLGTVVDLPFHDGAAHHAPMLTQLISYGLMGLTGDAGLTWLIQPVFLLILVRFFYLSARLLGLGRPPALTITALLLLFGPFLNSAVLTNNELAMTCGAAIALYGLLRLSTNPGPGVLWCAAGIALLLATKHVGVVYAGPVLLLLIGTCAWLWRRAPTGRGPRSRPRWGHVIGAVLLILLGSSFLLKSWLLYGNPMYPTRIALGSMTLFDGLYDSSVLIDHGWSLDALRSMLVRSDGPLGFNPPISVILWLGVAVSLLAAVQRLRERRGKGALTHWTRLAATVMFPVTAVVLFFAVVPFWREHRLLFPVYYAYWLAGAYALAVLQRRLRDHGQAHTTAIVPGTLLPLFVLMLIGKMVAFGLFSQALFWVLVPIALLLAVARRLVVSRRRGAAVTLAGLALAAVAVTLSYPAYSAQRRAVSQLHYPGLFGARGRAWVAVAKLNAEPGGQTIAHSGDAIIFPLFGRRLQNRVLYVPIHPDDRPQPVTLERGDVILTRLARARRRRVDPDFWLAQLAERNVELLYLVDDPNQGGVSEELEIIARHPQRFRRLFQDGNVYLYRVHRP